MNKFWTIKNEACAEADIYIYGDITSYAWEDNDTTAKSFVDDLNSLNGQAVTVHINSGGGDVFAGLAIYNVLREYGGGVTVSIDGLAASAASVIAMAGNPIKMASNALIMTHEPAVGLYDFYDAAGLSAVQASLEAVRGSLIETYATRTDAATAEELITSETWLNAKDALELGLIDEITGAIPLQIDDVQRKIFVNSLAISTKNYDSAKMIRAMAGEKMIRQAKTPAVNAAAILQQERQRVRELKALKSENAAANAIIEVAIEDGRSVKEVAAYIAALKNVPTAQSAADKITAIIRDQMTSGAAGLIGGQAAPDAKELQAKKIAEFANGMI